MRSFFGFQAEQRKRRNEEVISRRGPPRLAKIMPKRSLEHGRVDFIDEAREQRREHKLYVGNLDHRVTEYHIIKMFSVFGKIRCEEYMWHTHGPKRGEPRGFAFVEYSKQEDAVKAKEGMNGRMAFGRPLVVRFVDEKVVTHNADAPLRSNDSQLSAAGRSAASTKGTAATSAVACIRSAKITAIQNKLKVLDKMDLQQQDQEPPGSTKKSKSSSLRVHGHPRQL